MKVKVTYANKRRRAHADDAHQSSPLQTLDPEKDGVTRSEMAQRMLKRSRHVALVEQNEDNVERPVVQERLAKRMKRSYEPVAVAQAERGMLPRSSEFQADTHESVVQQPLPHEQLSLVQPSSTLSRTSSSALKENALVSPFSSRPRVLIRASKKRSPKRRLSKESRLPLQVKSCTLSTIFEKKGDRRLSRKDTISSFRGARSPMAAMHQRRSSSPSTSCMRSPVIKTRILSSPMAPSHAYNDVPDTPSFFNGNPQFHSTPLFSRVNNNALSHPFDADNLPSFSGESMDVCDNGTHTPRAEVPRHRQTISNGIPPSGEPTVGPSSVVKALAVTAKMSDTNESSRTNLSPGSRAVQGSLTRDAGNRAYIGEHMIPLHSSPSISRGDISTTKIAALAPSSAAQDGPSSAGDNGPLTPPTSPTKSATGPPLDLVQVMSKLELGDGRAGARFDEETHRSTRSTFQTRSHSLNEPVSETICTSKTTVAPKRTRASTIRASDFNRPQSKSIVGPVAGSAARVSSTALSVAGPSGSGVGARHTRKDTDSGPSSAKGALAAKVRAAVVISESDSEDELLLREPWLEDLECLGLSVPKKWKEGEADVLNLVAGKVWRDEEEPASSRRYWMRRR